MRTSPIIIYLCHTAEWYSRFTRVIFALRRVVLLRSGIREMCERYSRISYRYSRTSCECRAAGQGRIPTEENGTK